MEQELLTDAFTKEAQLVALASALKDYKHWHNPHSPNSRKRDPLTEILQVAFRAQLVDPLSLSQVTKVSLSDIQRCAEQGIAPDRRDRKHLSRELKRMLAIADCKI